MANRYEDQPATARRMYNARAEHYNTNSSFHVSFAQSCVDYLAPQPGDHVLDLCCGTGLVTFPAAHAVGPSGSVLGVDASDGMLAVAQKELQRLKADEGGWGNVQFVNGDVTRLDAIEEVGNKKFDAIFCCSALVLLEAPGEAVSRWAGYLKKGGKFVVDATHPQNLIAGIALEMVCARLGVQPPSKRLWSRTEADLKALLETVGLVVEDVKFQPQTGHEESYTVEDGDKVWSQYLSSEYFKSLLQAGFENEGKKMFLEAWKQLADEKGVVQERDGVFVARAHKPDNATTKKPVMKGSCACGAVTWSSIAPPFQTSHCLCVQCRKISGSPYLTLMEMPSWAVSFTPRYSELKSVNLKSMARRAFCGECGSTLTYQLFDRLYSMEVSIGSVDEEKMGETNMTEIMKNTKLSWCFTRSKMSWFTVPDDGLKRRESMSWD